MTSRPAGQHEQRAVVAERHVHLDERGHRQRDRRCRPAPVRARTRRPGRGSAAARRESMVSTFQFNGRRPASVIAAIWSTSSSLKPRRQPLVTYSSVVPSWSRTAPHSASTSSSRGPSRADRFAVAVGVRERERGREPEPAGRDRLLEQAGHRGELVGRRLVADRVAAHHVAPERAVADQETDVQADPVVDRVEVVAERAPRPRHAVLERGERHALDLRHHPAEVVGVLGVDGREREAAVARDHARHAVQVRRRRGRVPEELRVVVRVRVDEAGGDDEPVGVDRLSRLPR